MPRVTVNYDKYIRKNISRFVGRKLGENNLPKSYLGELFGIDKSAACRKFTQNNWTLDDLVALSKRFGMTSEDFGNLFETKK